MLSRNADRGNAHNSFRYRYCNTDTVYTYTRNHANEINYLREMMSFLRGMMPFSQRASVPSNHNHVSNVRRRMEEHCCSGMVTHATVVSSLFTWGRAGAFFTFYFTLRGINFAIYVLRAPRPRTRSQISCSSSAAELTDWPRVHMCTEAR